MDLKKIGDIILSLCFRNPSVILAVERLSDLLTSKGRQGGFDDVVFAFDGGEVLVTIFPLNDTDAVLKINPGLLQVGSDGHRNS